MSQLDIASMRRITHEKTKSRVVQGNGKMKSRVLQEKPSSRKIEFVLVVTGIQWAAVIYSGVCSDLWGFALATGDATIMAAGCTVVDEP